MASLKERLREDLTAAMRAQDDVVRSTLRMALTAVSKAEVAGKQQATMTDDEVIGIVRSETAKRLEAAEIYAGAGRDELARRERAEADVLASYLPADLSDAALAGIVGEEVARAGSEGISGPRAMGAVIKAVRARAGTQAGGARIAEAVRAAIGVKDP